MSSALCPNCRKPLPDKARFCMECGSRIDFSMTRKELDDDSFEAGVGLKVNRNETATSSFYGKHNSLKDKIINPDLSPLPAVEAETVEIEEPYQQDILSDQLDSEADMPKMEPVVKPNRIITSTVGGGFKRKSS